MNALPYIAQYGVHHKVLGGKGTHNAMWDFSVSPEGKVYFSLCSELIESSYARFCEYIPETDECRVLFKVEDVILPAYRTIRHSKIHTSINYLPDGHILMSTHTTDKSPVHPWWIPEGYYAHPWEGFSGSHLIEYDPVSGEVHTLGVPVPFESIYGGIYVEKTNRFYFLGYIRGHLYSYGLDDRQVKDYGQVTEYGCFRLHRGPDDKLYWSTRSGYLARLNLDTDEIEQLDARFEPSETDPAFSKKIMRLDYAVNVPDGKIIMAAVLTKGLYLFDTRTDELTCLGDYGEALQAPDPARKNSAVYGLAMDDYGVLWYIIEGRYESGTTATLARWDVFGGGKPEVLGSLGTPETRAVAGVCEAYIYKDVMYISDTNHANDLPAIFTIDLKTFRPHAAEHSVMPDDPYHTAGTAQYQDMVRMSKAYADFLKENDYSVKCSRWNAWKLWRQIRPEQSKVSLITYVRDGRYAGDIIGVCGGEGKERCFRISGGILSLKDMEETDGYEKDILRRAAARRQQSPAGEHKGLLAVPGRQYKAVITAACRLPDGRCFAGTQDGVVGIIGADQRIFRLGRVCVNGPVRDLACDRAGRVVYGVGGDENDLGTVFRYTDADGLQELGSLRMDADYDPGIHMSCEPCCLDVSNDGSRVCIGVRDRLGTVYELVFDD